MFEVYFQRIQEILQQVAQTQGEAITNTAAVLAKAIREHKCIYAFGCNHANLLAKELVYRTGGLVVINPVVAPGLDLDVRPVTMTTEMERMAGYGNVIVQAAGIGQGDVLIVHSVSGRNAASVDAALEAKKQGATVICLTNLAYSKSVQSRHPSGLHLYEAADVTLDNCGDIGDAVVDIPELGQKVAASSTVVGAAILNAVVVETIDQLVKQGVLPPVFISSNMEGGDAHNARVMAEYKDQIRYL